MFKEHFGRNLLKQWRFPLNIKVDVLSIYGIRGRSEGRGFDFHLGLRNIFLSLRLSLSSKQFTIFIYLQPHPRNFLLPLSLQGNCVSMKDQFHLVMFLKQGRQRLRIFWALVHLTLMHFFIVLNELLFSIIDFKWN